MAAVVLSISAPPEAAAAFVVELTPDGDDCNVVSVPAAALVAMPVVVDCAETVPVTAPLLNDEAVTVEEADDVSTRFVSFVTPETVYHVIPSVLI